ncbi:fibroblast growth factor 1-like [Acanthaster planci]|uniref:Fibroblast growth factor n=1 Tax=Acanthaster planci TaxID=133434 RepID=A0A8B7Z068_ACAPL|nr:fibroblast growth factor 1-like [Acanthaster planci]
MSTTSIFPLREYYCKSGYYLKINADGEVGGAEKSGDKNAVFEVSTVTCGVITMKAVNSGMYLAVDNNGKTHGKAQLDASCEFVEKFDPSGCYTVFQPRRFAAEGWHVALGRQGQARPAHKIEDDQKCAWFIPQAVGGQDGDGQQSDDEGAVRPGVDIDVDQLERLGFTPATGLRS